MSRANTIAEARALIASLTGHRIAAMEAALKAAIPVMRRTAAEYLESVMVRHNPDSIAPSEWAEIAPDLEAILSAEACMGRVDDDEDRERLWLNPILDAAEWRKHVEPEE